MYKYFLLFFSMYVMVYGDKVTSLSVDASIEKIMHYNAQAKDSIPTVADYKHANVLKVTQKNIKEVNQKIAQINTGIRDPHYQYKTFKDYIYDFSHATPTIKTLTLKDAKIALKNIHFDESSTVFLKLAVKTPNLGKYFEPKIDFMYKGKTYKQTIEPGTWGYRYFNLSALPLENNTTLCLKGKFISLDNQNVKLISFKNPSLKTSKILIIAPHPDDAEIAAYGLYSQYHDHVHIVTITAGDAGPSHQYNKYFHTSKSQYLAKGKKRTIESITVPLFGGVIPKNCLNLGFFDATLKAMEANKTKEVRSLYAGIKDIQKYRKYNISPLVKNLHANVATWYTLVNNLTSLLSVLKPDIIVTPYPAMDTHTDHKYATIALLEALKKAKIMKGKLYLYTNHYLTGETYPYGEVGEAISLPPDYKKAFYFNSIYSHPLSQNRQNNKVFALEAMSDLRFNKQKLFFDDKCKNKIHFLCEETSYLRRAVRSNELFFVVEIKNIYDEKVYQKLIK